MPTVERKLKLDFWGTKRRFFEILILRKPGDTPLGRIRVRLVPPFPKIRRTRESDFPSQSYGCLKFSQKPSVFRSRSTGVAPMLYCRPNFWRNAPVFSLESIGVFLLFCFIHVLYYIIYTFIILYYIYIYYILHIYIHILYITYTYNIYIYILHIHIHIHILLIHILHIHIHIHILQLHIHIHIHLHMHIHILQKKKEFIIKNKK